MKVKVAQSCPNLCDPMDYTVHGILQARILEWVAFPFSRGSSQHRDLPNTGLSHCGQILYQLSHNRSPRILEWVAYPFSRGPSRSRNWTRVSCIAGRFFANWAIREACMWSWLTSFTSLDLEQVHPWNGAIHTIFSQSYCLSRRGYLAGERMECFARRIMSLN